MPETGVLTSVALGANRISSVGDDFVMAPSRMVVDVPGTLENSHTYQITGSTQIGDVSLKVSDSTLDAVFIAALAAKTTAPLVNFIRGTAGGAAEIVKSVSVVAEGGAETTDTLRVQDLALSAGTDSVFRRATNGNIFDHTMAHAAGVSGAVDGTAVEVGALSASQSALVFYGNLHDPAATITTADAELQNASDSIFTSPVVVTSFAQVTSTKSYQLVTIAGPVAETWWRLSITAVVGGVYWPVCLVIPYTT